nr:PREDICTED: sterol 26-hydroxylase, mitochondrial-like [Paralichthys olivaceus]
MNTLAAAVRPLRLSAPCARTIPAAQELRPGDSSIRRNLNVQTSTETGRLKTIDELPGPSIPTSLYWMLFKGYSKRMHLMQVLQKNLYGPIWRSKVGSFEMVSVASSEFIAQVIQQEGRYPVRADMSHWKDYMDLRGHDYGLHVSTGTDWYQIRKCLNPKMLKLGEVSVYASTIQQVVGDMVQRIEVLRCRSQDQATVSDMAAELYKFGFEAVSSVLFETRLGCLQEDIPHDTLKFIAAVNTMLGLSDAVFFTPRWSRSILPLWKRFVQAWDDLCSVGQKLIDRRMAEIVAQVRSGEPADGLYLSYLLSSEKLTRSQIYITLTELLLGGVDTTSNTLTWTLYHLARDERAQELLYRQVNSVCPNKREPTTDDLSRMPYLKAVIKETLRLYPVVPGNGRYVTENEVIVGDYWFPKKTQFHLCHFAVCHDEATFPNPEQFTPDRWLRSVTSGWLPQSLNKHRPYSYIPFGVGVRACVGKRLAEMEMHFALSRLMQHYKVKPEEGATIVHPKTRVLLIPEKPINLRFLPRAE